MNLEHTTEQLEAAVVESIISSSLKDFQAIESSRNYNVTSQDELQIIVTATSQKSVDKIDLKFDIK